ncbi:unnamed protein product, partial [Urochloa humidicola]
MLPMHVRFGLVIYMLPLLAAELGLLKNRLPSGCGPRQVQLESGSPAGELHSSLALVDFTLTIFMYPDNHSNRVLFFLATIQWK